MALIKAHAPKYGLRNKAEFIDFRTRHIGRRLKRQPFDDAEVCSVASSVETENCPVPEHASVLCAP